MAKGFLPYSIDQRLLLPPDMREWLPEGHLALFISDVVDALDISPILRALAKADDRGRAGYHPGMMVKLLVYAYCVGKPSSRKIERATYEEVAFRVLSGDQHPDHDCIADFRKRHLLALAGLFVDVLSLCQKAGLVKLGHIAIDGSKFQANASKHKAMSYGRMGEAEKKLMEEVERLLQEAERVDAEEDAQHGKGHRGDELPKELARRESRIMPDGAHKGAFVQAYNVQIGVDAESQIIVACDLTQQPNDKQQLVPMAEKIVAAVGKLADTTSADAGYFSEEALLDPVLASTLLLVPPNREKHAATPAEQATPPRPDAPAKERMRHRLGTDAGRALYRMRKAVVEPVFGQIKDARGFRRFLLRGLSSARAEFAFIALTHNLLKLFRSGWTVAMG